MRDGRVFSSAASRGDRRPVSLCDHASPRNRCWGRGYTHKKLGGKRDGRDEGKLVAVLFTCEGHYEAGHSDAPGLFTAPGTDVGNEFWDDGFQFSYGGDVVVPRGDKKRGKAWSCKLCESDTVYYDRYDAFACLKCDRFAELPHCDGGCDAGFDAQPAKPSLSKYRYETWTQVFGGR
jgi:hypothetical protein